MVTSSITGSASFCLPAEPRGEADSSAFVLAAASTWPRRADTNANTVSRTIVLGYSQVVGIVGPRIVVLRLLLRQHHHHRPNRTAEPSFAVDIAALTAVHRLFLIFRTQRGSRRGARATATTVMLERGVLRGVIRCSSLGSIVPFVLLEEIRNNLGDFCSKTFDGKRSFLPDMKHE